MKNNNKPSLFLRFVDKSFESRSIRFVVIRGNLFLTERKWKIVFEESFDKEERSGLNPMQRGGKEQVRKKVKTKGRRF